MKNQSTEPTPKQKRFGLAGSFCWYCLSLLPIRLRWAVGSAIGTVLYWLVKSRRKVVLRNFELCFPEKPLAERKRLALGTFRNAGRGLLSWGFALFASQRRIDREVHWQGRDTLQGFCNLRRPVILLCPHFVSPMLTLRTIGAVTAVVSMYRPPRNPVFDMGYHCALTGIQSPYQWINRIYRKRGGHDVRMVSSLGNMRPFYQALQQATPFFYLPDQNANRPAHATFAPFFGVPAATFTSLTRFAKFADARIMLCHTVMSESPMRYEMHTELLPDGFISGDPQADAERLNQLIESLVRQAPDQYFWMHRRFGTRPQGEPPIY